MNQDQYLDSLYSLTDILFLANRFEEVDQWLATLEITCPILLVDILSATYPARHKLPSRKALYDLGISIDPYLFKGLQ